MMKDFLQGRDEEEAGAHDDLSQGQEGVNILALQTLPDLRKPMTEAVGYQDSSTKIQQK